MKAKHIRSGHVIYSVKTDNEGNHAQWIDCESVSKAKKRSRKMQEANGGLGCGYVMVL